MESPNSNSLPFFDEGQPISNQITARRMNSIVGTIRQNELRDGVGYTRTKGSGGTSLSFNRPRNPRAIFFHNYTVQDGSSTSTGPGVIVTLGNHIDQGSGMTYIPLIGGVSIASGPVLSVMDTDTLCYFHGGATGGSTITNGSVSGGIEILSGTSVPSSSATGGDWYQLVAFFSVTTGSSPSVQSLEGGVAGSQVVQFCGNGWIMGLQ